MTPLKVVGSTTAHNAPANETKPYRYDEFTDDEFKHFSKYGGTFTYIAELPHNTSFLVANGHWRGKVLHRDGKTFIQTTTDDSLCVNGDHQYEIDDRYYLWLSDLDGAGK